MKNKEILLIISLSLFLLVPVVLMQPSSHKVTMMLDFNINGIETDRAEVDGNGIGLYYQDNIENYYVCLEDTASSAVFGIASSGSLNYINLSKPGNYTMQLSQNSGSKFILPVTKGSCNAIKNKMPGIASQQFFIPYASFIKRPNNVTYIVLNYSIDIVGAFSKRSDFILIMEKNNSQIIMEGR
ncbi:MAG: hypothetical protein NT129_03000 [Candidatus Aenigmarchaeota archaeon]|nr:hypothetical protein [Candidatus Aenigmarchaeota archaeon]